MNVNELAAYSVKVELFCFYIDVSRVGSQNVMFTGISYIRQQNIYSPTYE